MPTNGRRDLIRRLKVNNYCLSNATVVTRTRLKVTLYVHCLSCNLHLWCFSVIFNASRCILCESVIMAQLCRNMSLNTFGTFQTEMHFGNVLLTYTQHIQKCTSVPVGTRLCVSSLFCILIHTVRMPAPGLPAEFWQFTSLTHLIYQSVHRHCHANCWLIKFTLEHAIIAQRVQ